jgi:hypothetical protein
MPVSVQQCERAVMLRNSERCVRRSAWNAREGGGLATKAPRAYDAVFQSDALLSEAGQLQPGAD